MPPENICPAPFLPLTVRSLERASGNIPSTLGPQDANVWVVAAPADADVANDAPRDIAALCSTLHAVGAIVLVIGPAPQDSTPGFWDPEVWAPLFASGDLAHVAVSARHPRAHPQHPLGRTFGRRPQPHPSACRGGPVPGAL